MKRVLVTGASGFVGRHVLPHLSARGFEIFAVGRDADFLHSLEGVSAVPGDLLIPGEAARIVERVRPSHLLHLAWYAKPGRYWTAPENLDWVAASLGLFHAFVRSGGRRAVFAGTCAEYDWSFDFLSERGTPPNPATLYGKSKRALQDLVTTASGQMEVSVAWGRLFFLYGPHEASGRLVSDAVRSLLAGESFACSEGTQLRDFMYVDDAARAFSALLDDAYEGTVNIATGETVPVRLVIETIGDITGRSELIHYGARPSPPNDPPRLGANTDVLNNRIGFRPAYDLRSGLEKTVEWWRHRT